MRAYRKSNILDSSGNPAVVAYEAASRSRRLQGWKSSDASINNFIYGGLGTIRSRTRQMARDDNYAQSAKIQSTAKVIGNGIRPQLSIEDDQLKNDILRYWRRFVRYADADGRLNFYGMQALIFSSLWDAGEMLVRFRNRRSTDNFPVPLQLQLLEPEHLPITKNETTQNGNMIKMGIEFNRINQRVRYHLYREYPGEMMFPLNTNYQTVPIRASEILHIYPMTRAGQIRGMPMLVNGIIKLRQLNEYDDLQLEKQKSAAAFAGFIIKPDVTEKPFPDGATSPTYDSDEILNVEIESNTLNVLAPGEEIKFSDPPDLGGQYEDFQYRNLLAVAASMGVPYYVLTGDLRAVNYSSIRAGTLLFRSIARQQQHHLMIHQFIQPVWERFIDTLIVSQLVTIPDVDQIKYDVEWITPHWEFIDPMKDAQGEKMEIRMGVKSRSHAVHQRGFDPVILDNEIAEDNARADELGLAFDSDPRVTTLQGQGQNQNVSIATGEEIDEETDEPNEESDGSINNRLNGKPIQYTAEH